MKLNKYIFLFIAINFLQITIFATEVSEKGDTKASLESKIQQESKEAREAEITIIPSQEQAPKDFAEFLLAIIHGKADELVKLLKIIPKSYLNTKIKDELTPLEFAITTTAYDDAVKQLQIINLLLDNGANPNVITSDNINQLSNLFLKVKPEYLGLVEKIVIKLGNNIDKQDIHGRMLLDAARTNNLELVKILLINGAYKLINIVKILSLISLEIEEGKITNREILDFLIKFNEHIKNFDEAIRNYDCKNLKDLLDEKLININKYELILGYIPLFYAIKFGNKDIVQILINAGADVNAKGPSGSTALRYAIYYNKKDVIQILIKAGADVNAKDSFGDTALMIASGDNNKDVIQILINAGADVNARDRIGNTVLMKAALTNNKEWVQILLNAGADVNIRNTSGLTALNLASDEIKKILEPIVKEQAKIQKVLRLIHRG